jgi:hypothetical protein
MREAVDDEEYFIINSGTDGIRQWLWTLGTYLLVFLMLYAIVIYFYP